MTQTSTPHSAPLRPADMLTCLLATVLAPMFLLATEGDLTIARAAALQTITEHRAQGGSIISAAETVAFGIAAVSSLSLSMTENLSIPLILKLRGNANGLNRSISRAEQSLGIPCQPANTLDEAAVIASVAELRTRTAEAIASYQPAQPPAARTPQPAAAPTTQPANTPGSNPQPAAIQPTANPAPSAPSATLQPPRLTPDADQHRLAGWAAAMTRVAGEFVAEIPGLPPTQRREATMRAAILSSTANALLAGETGAGSVPGDLAALLQPKKP